MQGYLALEPVAILMSIADLKRWKKGTVLEFKEHAGLVCLVEVR